MITDPVFYLFAIPSVLLFGMAKGGMGGGVALVSVPLIAMVLPPLQAAAVLLPVLLVMDGVAIWSFRAKFHWRSLQIMLPGALLGILIGTFTFRYLSEDAIRILIAIISLVFAGNYYIQVLVHKREPPPAGDNLVRGSFWGAVGGFTSFGIHAGGPPINVYMLPLRLERKLLMGTLALFFGAVNLVKVVPYLWLGQLDSSTFITSLVLMPIAPFGVRLGYYLLHRVTDNFIYQISYLFLIVIGIKLMYEGVSGILSN